MFYLAGGFAEHLDLDAARRIGFIPDLPDHKVAKLGNTSIEGAALATSTAIVAESIMLYWVAKRRLGFHVFIMGGGQK